MAWPNAALSIGSGQWGRISALARTSSASRLAGVGVFARTARRAPAELAGQRHGPLAERNRRRERPVGPYLRPCSNILGVPPGRRRRCRANGKAGACGTRRAETRPTCGTERAIRQSRANEAGPGAQGDGLGAFHAGASRPREGLRVRPCSCRLLPEQGWRDAPGVPRRFSARPREGLSRRSWSAIPPQAGRFLAPGGPEFQFGFSLAANQ